MRKFVIVAATAIVAASSAVAGQKNDSFDVKVKITGTCNVVAPDLDFGSIDSVAGTETVSGDIEVKCSNTLAYNISLSAIGSTTSVSGNLAGVNPLNLDTIPFTVALPATVTGTGDGLGALVTPDTFSMTASLTAASTPAIDDYVATRTVYVNF